MPYDSLTYESKNITNKQTKLNSQTQRIDQLLPEGKEVENLEKQVKDVYMVRNGNETFGGDHFIVYSNVELQYVTIKHYTTS